MTSFLEPGQSRRHGCVADAKSCFLSLTSQGAFTKSRRSRAAHQLPRPPPDRCHCSPNSDSVRWMPGLDWKTDSSNGRLYGECYPRALCFFHLQEDRIHAQTLSKAEAHRGEKRRMQQRLTKSSSSIINPKCLKTEKPMYKNVSQSWVMSQTGQT